MELPYVLRKKVGEEEKSMAEFWDREVKHVQYVKKRFEIREEILKKLHDEREKSDQIESSKDSQKNDERKNEDEQIEKQYQEFCENYLESLIKTHEKKVKKKP